MAYDEQPINLDDPPSRWHLLTSHVQAVLLRLAVIDERQQHQLTNEQSIKRSLEKVVDDVAELKGNYKDLETRLSIVQKIVFGMIAAACVAVLGAILRLVIV